MFVALVVQHAMRMRHIVIYCLPGSTEFFNVASWTAGFPKTSYWTQICASIFSTMYVCNISHPKSSERGMINMYIGFHEKYPLSLSDLKETWII